MSYSAVPASYDDDALESPALSPPRLQLLNFEFPRPSSVKGRDRSGSKASKVKSSIHSGTSYEMVNSDTESDYDAGEGSGRTRQKLRETGGGDSRDRMEKDQGHVDDELVSRFPSRDMQGGASHSNGNQQHHAQQHQEQEQKHSHPAARGGDGHMHPRIAGRLGLQLDGRADSNEQEQRGGVSPRHEYEAGTSYQNNDSQPGSGREGSRSQPLPPPPEPEFLGRRDSTYQTSAPPDGIHPVFRHSQSVPELPPIDVGPPHFRDDRDFRPATSASGVGDLFKDFDGVHFDIGNPEAPGFPLRSQHPAQPPAHQQRHSQAYPRPVSQHSGSQASLVFYPAPVPAMLNLPPTLSKARPNNNRNSRHLAPEPTGSPGNNRRSAAYPGPGGPALQSDKDLNRRSAAPMNSDQLNNRRSLANLPPALRASQFFDSQLPPIAPELKEESAVATLDSILDASAKAPAAAFTDHPSAPSAQTHAQTHARNQSTQFGNYRNSVAVNVRLHPGESPRSSVNGDHPDHHHHRHLDDEDDANSHLNPETGEYYDPTRFSGVSDEFGAPSSDPSQQPLPTTLLAELESRKAQQKLRSRTAASAFPRGIRSTLLQLDAVAQVQQQHRRAKKTHLAWEEPEDGPDEEEKDEDVPLALLFAVPPGVQKRRDEEVPLGLLMKKEMEDAEPLSKRRERLRQQNGVPTTPRRMLDVPGLGAAEDEEVEGETLKERMKRLKERQKFGSGTLDIDLMSDKGKDQQQLQQAEAKPEVEETLAQRRRRLQREKEQEANTAALKRESVVLQQEVKNRRNMADILHVRPMGMAARPQSFYAMHGGGAGGPNGSFGQLQQGGYAQGMGGVNRGMGGMGGYGMSGPGLIGRGAGAMGMGGGVMAMGMGGEVVLDPKQREVVERWRASVM